MSEMLTAEGEHVPERRVAAAVMGSTVLSSIEHRSE
jgi:hypothetical protein